MKPPSFSLLLGLAMLLLSESTVSAVTLNVSPNRQQFFSGESVRLSCEEGESSAEWKLKRISVLETETCGAAEGFGRLNGSTCVVSNLSPSKDRGSYWCEHRSSGRKSIKVTVTVSDRPFIMEIPALPVMAGCTVTLRCRNSTGSTIAVNFFKFGRHGAPIRAAPEGELTIRNVRRSDEGFYWCSRGQTTSPSSRLSVMALPPSPPPPTNSSAIVSASPLLRLLCHLVAITPYCISTGLIVAIYYRKKTGKTPAITMEMAQHNESGLDDEYVNDIADVTTEHDF